MWRYLAGVGPPEPKKKKSNEEKLEQQRLYDNSTRQRDFLPEWQNTFSWLRYDCDQKVMHCLYCTDYNSQSFKKDTLTKHDGSKRYLFYLVFFPSNG